MKKNNLLNSTIKYVATKNIFVKAIVCLLLTSYNLFSQTTIWQTYTPVQSNAIGKLIMGKNGKEISIGEQIICTDLKIVNDSSATSLKQEFNKNFGLNLGFFIGKYAQI